MGLTTQKMVLDTEYKTDYNSISKSKREPNMNKIMPPTNCPSCESELVWVNDNLFCRNNDCSSKAEKKIEHFAKTLKIKGLGPSAISKLGFSTILDIYNTSRETIIDRLSSAALGSKLFAEIKKSEAAPLNVVLAGFGIPLIGMTLSARLSKTCDSIDDITEVTCEQAGLGPKATNNLLNWLETEYPLLHGLPFSFRFERKEKPDAKKGVVCISGKLNSFATKALATTALEEAGYEVKSSITKDVTILVNEGGVESSKTVKARNSGINVINNLKILLEK